MSTKKRLFKHAPILSKFHGKIKLYCQCGGQTKRVFETEEAALAAHREHVGLREKQASVLMP